MLVAAGNKLLYHTWPRDEKHYYEGVLQKNKNAKIQKYKNGLCRNRSHYLLNFIQSGVDELDVSRCQSSAWIPTHSLKQDSDCFEFPVTEVKVVPKQSSALRLSDGMSSAAFFVIEKCELRERHDASSRVGSGKRKSPFFAGSHPLFSARRYHIERSRLAKILYSLMTVIGTSSPRCLVSMS